MIKKMLFATLAATLFVAPAAFAMDPVMQGHVAYVDPTSNTVILANGEELQAAPNLSVAPLQEDQDVTFAVHNGPDGQKEISAFWIDGGSEGSSD